MRQTNLEEAMNVARTVLREYLEIRNIPEHLRSKLSLGGYRDGNDWIVEVSLHERKPDNASLGLKEDLDGPKPKLILSIRVDAKTGATILTEIEALA